MGSIWKALPALVTVAFAAVSLAFPTAAAAELPFAPCPGRPAVECARLDVPLDRSGASPGTLGLHVERLPAGAQQRVMLLVAGGPGQASAEVFDLESPFNAAYLQSLFPNYTLVAFDPRGTGRSGLLRCGRLERSSFWRWVPEDVAECAAAIGPRRRFFTTRDHAADIEAVRVGLGVAKIAVWGTSYGTKLAQAYAALYPAAVERLLLDSALPLEGDPLNLMTLRAMPQALASLCAGGACRRATPAVAADVVVVARRLARRPLSGTVVSPSGRIRRERLTAASFLDLVVEADLNPGLAAHLPAVVRAARLGWVRPLLRLAAIVREISVDEPGELSIALFASTVCGEGPFPWLPSQAANERRRALEQAVAALPPGSMGPFGPWALRTSPAEFCLSWPEWAPTLPIGRPLPDVPVLVLAGELDMRTPVPGSAEVARRFPQGRLVVVPGVGHSVLGQDRSGCAEEAVAAWLRGAATPARCPRSRAIVPPIGAIPRSLASLRRGRGRGALAAATLRAVRATLEEARATFVLGFFASDGAERPVQVGGLYGGRLATPRGTRGMTLTRYTVVRGVTVTGTLSLASFLPTPRFTGRLRVCGSGARGAVRVEGARLRGRLAASPARGRRAGRRAACA